MTFQGLTIVQVSFDLEIIYVFKNRSLAELPISKKRVISNVNKPCTLYKEVFKTYLYDFFQNVLQDI